jgi:hypothetical protein
MDSLNLYLFKGVFSLFFHKNFFTPQEFSFTSKMFFRLLFTDDRCVATDRKKRFFKEKDADFCFIFNVQPVSSFRV